MKTLKRLQEKHNGVVDDDMVHSKPLGLTTRKSSSVSGYEYMVISFEPADGAKAVAVGSNLQIGFNGPVQRGTG